MQTLCIENLEELERLLKKAVQDVNALKDDVKKINGFQVKAKFEINSKKLQSAFTQSKVSPVCQVFSK